MDYDVKANLTTVLSFLLFPVLAGIGVDAITSSAFVSLFATVIFFALAYLNERYLSGIFTKTGYSVVNESNIPDDTTPESAINQEYN